jgi:alkylation response protein AidB-like acyl-CoA dehydrogenase
MDIQTITGNIQEISNQFDSQRRERQIRRHLEQADFDLLAEAGFHLTSLPREYGGFWKDVASSTRQIGELVRILAQGDPSVALVACMHPAVLFTVGWLSLDPPPAERRAWKEQLDRVFSTVQQGAWWGTITSEPGSGGDLARTRAVAAPTDGRGRFLLSGQKHFGSGSGIASYMITTGVVEGEPDYGWFFMDMRDLPWDGSAGVTLSAPWDGHGMTATQSHGMTFNDFPVSRVVSWPSFLTDLESPPRGLGPAIFTAVNVGIVQKAMQAARQQLGRRHSTLRAYEQVEWARAEMEAWLIEQAYEGMLTGLETCGGEGRIIGMKAVSELSETLLGRLCKIIGGGTYARQSPFGFWQQDVRALGFIRPPWGLAFDSILADAVRNAAPQPETTAADPAPATAAG